MPLVTVQQAAEVLGVGVASVYALASAGSNTRHSPRHARGQTYDLEEVERRSLGLLKYHDYGHAYWLNVSEVADYLGVHRSRVRQLQGLEKLPSVTAPNGRRYVRRHRQRQRCSSRQVRLIAGARYESERISVANISDGEPPPGGPLSPGSEP